MHPSSYTPYVMLIILTRFDISSNMCLLALCFVLSLVLTFELLSLKGRPFIVHCQICCEKVARHFEKFTLVGYDLIICVTTERCLYYALPISLWMLHDMFQQR